MAHSPVVCGLCGIALVLASELSAQQMVRPDSALEIREYFAGTALARTKTGAPRPVHLVIRQWAITGHQMIKPLPQTGFLLIQLRAGEVTTVISGKEQSRNQDDFWTVPKGVPMTVRTGRDVAVLETVAIDP